MNAFNMNLVSFTNKKIKIFEQATCCAKNGVSKSDLDRIDNIIEKLNLLNIHVERYNLSASPMEFVNNKAIHNLLVERGIGQLPITVVDEKIVYSSRYPTNAELIELVGIKELNQFI